MDTKKEVSIESLLKDRSVYGNYEVNSKTVQQLKTALRNHPNWCSLPMEQRETLEMCVHKFGRILGGHNDPSGDSWTDCVGYIELIRNPPK